MSQKVNPDLGVEFLVPVLVVVFSETALVDVVRKKKSLMMMVEVMVAE